MKYAISALGLTLLVTAGCQNKKPADSVTDLGAGSSAVNPAVATATPVTYQASPQPGGMEAASVTATPAPGGVASGASYTVKPGDTLWRIAANHYGDGKKWKQIADANPGLTPEKLKVGQTITLP